MTLNLLKLATILHFIVQSFQQLTFNSRVGQGLTCTTTVLSTSQTRLDCTGFGFITADSLSSIQTTYLNVTVLSASVAVGIGLGQRPDSSCKNYMFPPSGRSWYNCSSTCDSSNCLYNYLTAFTSSTYANSLSPSLIYQVGKKYTWQLVPPPSAGFCWQITLSMAIPDGSFSSTPVNSGYTCSMLYGYGLDYSLYFELENYGTASFLLESTAAHCAMYSGETCYSCNFGYFSNDGICQACDSSCQTCSGTAANACTSCYGDQIAVKGVCQSCNSSQYPESMSQTCISCTSNCKTCSGSSTSCTSCPTQSQMLLNGKCIECASFTYADQTKKQCIPCHSACSMCTGPTINNCKTCAASGKVPVNGFCTYCGYNQFADPNTISCQSCDPSCGTCTGPNTNQCTTCYLPDEAPTSGSCPQSQLALVQKPKPTSSSAKTAIIVVVLLLIFASVAVIGIVWYRKSKRKLKVVDPSASGISRPVSPAIDDQDEEDDDDEDEDEDEEEGSDEESEN